MTQVPIKYALAYKSAHCHPPHTHTTPQWERGLASGTSCINHFLYSYKNNLMFFSDKLYI